MDSEQESELGTTVAVARRGCRGLRCVTATERPTHDGSTCAVRRRCTVWARNRIRPLRSTPFWSLRKREL